MPEELATKEVIREVLGIIQTAFNGVAQVSSNLFAAARGSSASGCEQRLRIISPLAEGADQWVADEALKLGFELQCPLPFERSEYRKDFTASPAAAEFDRLLAKATAVLEMDGKADFDAKIKSHLDSRSYEAAGRAVLNQSDLLVAIWDRKPAQGRGGTGQVVAEALQRGIPVVWIPWEQPGAWRLQLPAWHLLEDTNDVSGDAARLIRVVRELLLPPEDANCRSKMEDLRETYFAEQQRHGNFQHGVWLLFRNLVSGELFTCKGLKELFALKSFHVADFVETAEQQAQSDWDYKQSARESRMDHPIDPAVRSWADNAFLRHYAWANGLSVYFGNLYRSAFVLNFLGGTTAVFLALVCIAAGIKGQNQTAWILAELVVILGIIGLTQTGRRRHWHQRWIDYRTLAERLRVARCTSLFGGGGPQVVHAGHLASYGNPARTWMHWHYRAIERAAGLPVVPASKGPPSLQFTKDYLHSCEEFWRESLVQDQRNYHQGNGKRLTTLDRRLHRGGDLLFVGTFLACLLHLLLLRIEGEPRFDWIPHQSSDCLTLFCAFLPALGAALAAIRSQAEAQRLAQRSEAMAESLRRLQLDLASVPIADASLQSQRLRDCVDRVSDLMIKEMLDWRVVFQDRPLVLPM